MSVCFICLFIMSSSWRKSSKITEPIESEKLGGTRRKSSRRQPKCRSRARRYRRKQQGGTDPHVNAYLVQNFGLDKKVGFRHHRRLPVNQSADNSLSLDDQIRSLFGGDTSTSQSKPAASEGTEPTTSEGTEEPTTSEDTEPSHGGRRTPTRRRTHHRTPNRRRHPRKTAPRTRRR